MKAMTIYRAADGARFDSAEKCREHEGLMAVVAEAMAPLGEPPAGYGDDMGYLPHDPAAVAEVRRRLVAITRKRLAWWFQSQLEKSGKELTDAHPDWFCRLLDGSALPLERAWSRLWRIDGHGREWSQIYYAEHPDEARVQAPYTPKAEANR